VKETSLLIKKHFYEENYTVHSHIEKFWYISRSYTLCNHRMYSTYYCNWNAI